MLPYSICSSFPRSAACFCTSPACALSCRMWALGFAHFSDIRQPIFGFSRPETGGKSSGQLRRLLRQSTKNPCCRGLSHNHIVNLSMLEEDAVFAYISHIKNKMQISKQFPRQKEISLFGQAIIKQQYMLLEALGDFPKWMFEHTWLPFYMTHGHWMANNLFLYYPMLILSVFLFAANKIFFPFGVGILIWGLINFFDHFFYTIKARKVSPGLITGTLFLINSCFGLRSFILAENFSLIPLLTGTVIGGVLFGLPILLCVKAYPVFDKYFK